MSWHKECWKGTKTGTDPGRRCYTVWHSMQKYQYWKLSAAHNSGGCAWTWHIPCHIALTIITSRKETNLVYLDYEA